MEHYPQKLTHVDTETMTKKQRTSVCVCEWKTENIPSHGMAWQKPSLKVYKSFTNAHTASTPASTIYVSTSKVAPFVKFGRRSEINEGAKEDHVNGGTQLIRARTSDPRIRKHL